MNSCSSTQIPLSFPINTPQIPPLQLFDQPPSPDLPRVDLLEKIDALTFRTFKDLMSEAFREGLPYYIAFNLGLDNQLRPYDAFNLLANLNTQKNDPNSLQKLNSAFFNPDDDFRIYRVTKGNPGTLKYFSRFKELNNNTDHNLKFIYAAAPSTVRPKVIAQSSFYRAITLSNENKRVKWFIRSSKHGSYQASLALFLFAKENNLTDLAKMCLSKALDQVKSKNHKNPDKVVKIEAIARAYIDELEEEETTGSSF